MKYSLYHPQIEFISKCQSNYTPFQFHAFGHFLMEFPSKVIHFHKAFLVNSTLSPFFIRSFHINHIIFILYLLLKSLIFIVFLFNSMRVAVFVVLLFNHSIVPRFSSIMSFLEEFINNDLRSIPKDRDYAKSFIEIPLT